MKQSYFINIATNISNVSKGQIFKNYKELCEALVIPFKNGNTRIAQLKELSQYIDYIKDGHKFIIKEIYPIPLVKQDLRSQGNNAALYIEDIEQLILDLLGQKQNSGQLFLSKNKLLKELKMINDNYTYYIRKQIDLSNVINISLEEINDFYESSTSTLKSNLETALNRLNRQSLIYWTYALTVCFIDIKVETTDTGKIKATKREVIDKKGNATIEYDTVKPIKQLSYRKATEEEIRIIREIERDTLIKYNCEDNPAQLFKIGKIEDYYKEVREQLFDRTNIIFYYNSYEILFNDRHIKQKLNQLKLKEFKRDHTQISLNGDIMDKLIENATNRHDNANEAVYNNILDEDLSKKTEMRAKKEYISNTDKLTETLINKDCPKLYN